MNHERRQRKIRFREDGETRERTDVDKIKRQSDDVIAQAQLTMHKLREDADRFISKTLSKPSDSEAIHRLRPPPIVSIPDVNFNNIQQLSRQIRSRLATISSTDFDQKAPNDGTLALSDRGYYYRGSFYEHPRDKLKLKSPTATTDTSVESPPSQVKGMKARSYSSHRQRKKREREREEEKPVQVEVVPTTKEPPPPKTVYLREQQTQTEPDYIIMSMMRDKHICRSVTIVQRLFRARRIKSLRRQEIRHERAIEIQRCFRGYIDRKKVHNLRRERAVTILQSFVRRMIAMERSSCLKRRQHIVALSTAFVRWREKILKRRTVWGHRVQFHPGRDFPAQEICSEEGRDVMALAFLNWITNTEVSL
ncbi:ASPM-like protein [Planoprotostelium fungivorum]|uniref:ASPM-like protein n=1 Tax=Planoprotostelium fungivorum TaxID=1890364 RepID=A0A2P6MRR9_9EUKA|nr:ASPM-like protein [Planoprotostelium fungivorum]